ncbi:MAG TPA: hypothetical protein PLO78_04760 [Candidatus Omnitrophota bacterium]|nr:hypothetical protein [Candidatus Omnitrophota bacterium]
MKFEPSKDNQTIAFWGTLVVLVFISGFFLMKNIAMSADETVHAPIISDILGGTNLFPTHCPYLPGYHWSMALLMKLCHVSDFISMRTLTALLSFLCFVIFFMLANKVDRDSAIQKSLLFLFFPLFFPFFFLVYTDIYSMFYVFLALWAALNKRLWLSGMFGILSLFVRQNNIIWLAFIGLLVYFQNYYPQYRWRDIKRWMPKFFFFFLAAILLVAFAILNKGLIIGDKAHHFLTLTCGNIFFSLFLFFFFFLPLNLRNFPKIVAFLKQNKIMWLILIELFLVYYLFFNADHPYNRFGRFIRTWIMFMMTASLFNRFLTFLPIAYAVLSLCVTRLHRPSFYLFYPFAILFLLPLSFVEIRYSFIPFSLFLLFKEKDSERIILMTHAINIVVIGCLIFLMWDGSFFP